MYNTNTYLYMCACAFKYTQLGDTYFFYLFFYLFIHQKTERKRGKSSKFNQDHIN